MSESSKRQHKKRLKSGYYTSEKYKKRNRERMRKCREDPEFRKRDKQNRNKYLAKLKQQVDDLLGTKCYFGCDNIRLHCHRKDGVNHNAGGTNMRLDVIAEPHEFVRLCQICHKGVHFCTEKLGMTWDDITHNL